MAPFYLIAYVVFVGLFIRFTTGWDRDKLPVIAFILIVAFIGWFVLIGMLIEGDGKKSGISVTSRGAKSGITFLGSWLFYMLVLIAAGTAWAVIKWILTGR